MGLIPTQVGGSTGVADRAVMRINAKQYTYKQYGVVGLAAETASSHQYLYDRTWKPFSTGVASLNAAGSYLYATESGGHGEPVETILIYNPGPTAIRVGYNIPVSGTWNAETGFPLGSGDSIQFGGLGIATVRNAWAKSPAGDVGSLQVVYVQTALKDHGV
jgi:hypothetical protein